MYTVSTCTCILTCTCNNTKYWNLKQKISFNDVVNHPKNNRFTLKECLHKKINEKWMFQMSWSYNVSERNLLLYMYMYLNYTNACTCNYTCTCTIYLVSDSEETEEGHKTTNIRIECTKFSNWWYCKYNKWL